MPTSTILSSTRSPDQPAAISYKLNCGNLSAGVVFSPGPRPPAIASPQRLSEYPDFRGDLYVLGLNLQRWSVQLRTADGGS